MDDEIINKLIEALGDSDSYVRGEAAEALGKIGDTRAVEPLIRALGDRKYDVRENAAEALWRIGAPAVEPLIRALVSRALEDSNGYVQGCAAKALDKLHWSPTNETEKVYYLIAKKAWYEAVSLGNAAVEPLIRALEDSVENVRWNAAEALRKIGSPAVEPLIKALGDSDSYARVREEAAEALGKIGDTRAVEPLIMALRDSNSAVQWKAAEALDKLHWSPTNETEKVYYLIAKKEWYEAVSLGNAAVEPLIRALGDSDSYARVREEAAEALGKIGVLAVEPLIKALRDSNSAVRWKAAETLDKLHWSPVSDTEKAYYFIARRDWASVVSLGVPAIELLIRVQGDNNTGVQMDATDALNKIYSQIIEVIFGEISSNNNKTCVKNPETSKWTIHMGSLRKILIDADTYDFDMVERFITYAINYVGQKHLRKKVEVYIYGNPEKLHQNLLNSFRNLCRKVITQEK